MQDPPVGERDFNLTTHQKGPLHLLEVQPSEVSLGQQERFCASVAGAPDTRSLAASPREDKEPPTAAADCQADPNKGLGAQSPAGRLKRHLAFWERELKPSAFVLNTIKNGYSIPFVSPPAQCCIKNNMSSLKNKDFVIQKI